MAREQRSTTIDGVWFEVTQLGFSDGRKVFVRLSKLLGPSIAALADKAPSLAALASSRGLSDAVTRALGALEDEDLEWLTSVVAKGARYSLDGGTKRPMLDAGAREELFSGRITLWGKWLFWALSENFGDFSEALSALRGPGREGETPASSTASIKS